MIYTLLKEWWLSKKNSRVNFISFLQGHTPIFLILFAYLLIHLTNLTLLPIFNDESIYLHWGFIEVQNYRDLYHSLYDGKQPLLMWIFGLFQMYISDPLMAGRLVSVIFGFFTIIGIYLVAKKIGNERVAIIAILLYAVLPLFVFYNRQALMESAVSFVGVWMFYLFLKNIPKPRIAPTVLLGIVVGIGLFIKSSVFVFVVPLFILTIYVFLRQKNNFNRRQIFMAFILSIVISQLVLLPLYLQIDFLNIINMSSRYTYTLHEILQFPVVGWMQNTKTTFEILFWYLTPVILLLSLFGIFKLWKKGTQAGKFLIVWLIIPLIIFIFTVRNPSTRYIVAFVPYVTIFCAYAIVSLKKKYQMPTLLISLILPTALTFLLIFSPLSFFRSLEKVTTLVDYTYIEGWTSGYGVQESAQFLTAKANKEKIKVFIKSATGNPENALYVYLRNNKNIRIDSLSDITCTDKTKIRFALHKTPIYFVSRDNINEEDQSCFEKEKIFYKPKGDSFIVIYKFTTLKDK